MRLKSHESPRQQGRNKRGRGGTARKRQLDKRNRTLRHQILSQNPSSGSSTEKQIPKQRGDKPKITDPVLNISDSYREQVRYLLF